MLVGKGEGGGGGGGGGRGAGEGLVMKGLSHQWKSNTCGLHLRLEVVSQGNKHVEGRKW